MPYTTEEMERLWSDEMSLRMWTEIELAVLEAQAECGVIDASWVPSRLRVTAPDVEQWRATTQECGHEFVAFLNLWPTDHVHIGLTSSDVIDTALSIRVVRSTDHIANAIDDLLAQIEYPLSQFGAELRLGRTHGQAATVTTVGQMLVKWQTALERSQARLVRAADEAGVCMVSGPVGSYVHTSRQVEMHVADTLDLRVLEVTTQIIPRDLLAAWVAELGVLASTIESIATDIRYLAQESISEVRDERGSSSSSMPHKLNPSRLERLCGLARVVRSAYEPIAAGVAYWGERDLVHSSVERTLLPQACGIVHYALRLLSDVIGNLQFDVFEAFTNLTDRAWETRAHSVQTGYQLEGLSYPEAQAATRALMRANLTASALRLAIPRNLMNFERPEPDFTHLEGRNYA